MLKWAVTPRFNSDYFENEGINNNHGCELLTLQAIIDQHRLPCLVRLISDDINESTDNYCLLLCQTNDPYLLVSNETERFSIPMSFDGLFAPVEKGVTRYNILESVRALRSHLKSHPSSSSGFSYFTVLQPCMAYSNSALRRIRPGTILEPCHTSIISSRSPSPSVSSSSTSSSNRLRTLFANLPHTINKHLLPQHQQSRAFKNQIPPSDYLKVKSIQHDESFCLKSDSIGVFVPVHTELPSNNSHRRASLLSHSSPFSSSSSSNQIQGLYSVELLSKLTHQYPLITELVISRTLEENVPTTVGYPFRRLTLHRLFEKHTRIVAFDMKNYAFLELDAIHPMDLYVFEPEDALFQRYQAQLRWCESHISSFRSQIKTIVHSSHGTPTFVQATPLHGQQLQQYHQRRDSSSSIVSPLTKHMPQTIFTSQESISSIRSRTRTPSSSKFNTTSIPSKQEQQQQQKGKTTGSGGTARKDVRVYFNDPTIQKRLQVTSLTSTTRPMIKQTSFNTKHSNYRTNSTESDSVDGDEDNEDSYQCTPL
ncbi:unnamed protein product [Rotaria sp. Silwood1]|nr:unnamed protein product [Rotaria sp. Silwood1]CAF0954151.1 unnamed protein product [Rotaria sp. Silwood1]CAF3355150.1 unnamed protein product [Rotaria sp. Silwood1]CAF3420776.1 unnamed protein product [Rotaria sp. Silwood1]CAF3471044.1 unnamed protein product [Rotaria sp. Silwood1]